MTFQSFTVATIILVSLIRTSKKTFIYYANRKILDERVWGCRALSGQLLSIHFFFQSPESCHLKQYTSGLKTRERKRKKVENKRFDPEYNTTNLSVDTFQTSWLLAKFFQLYMWSFCCFVLFHCWASNSKPNIYSSLPSFIFLSTIILN